MQQFRSGDLQRRSGEVQDRALVEPIAITRNGRPRLVMLSIEEYERLKRRDRTVLRTEDMAESDIARIAASEPPADADAFDQELDGDASR
jgi:prevent-host-death family protein